MDKEFVPYTLALKLKALGYDETCFGYYDTDGLQVSTHYWYPKNKNTSFPESQTTNNPKISAPTFSQAFRWFREKYQLHSTITSISQESWQWHIQKPGQQLGKLYDEDFYTYEEAELACLDKLIEIVEQTERVEHGVYQ